MLASTDSPWEGTSFQIVEWFVVLQKHKGHVLIVNPVNALGKIARGVCYSYVRFLHEGRVANVRVYRRILDGNKYFVVFAEGGHRV
jgi:hypothetical protein